ncbi:MAG: hydroxymethylglutaryl-CoA reductase, degradative [Chloroflexi bacterium]|nr:hydroxymethylglutaryl-CoA reductase, degradative [Chloroflexota bacterium]
MEVKMTKKFYKQSISQRLNTLASGSNVTPEDLQAYLKDGGLDLESANAMVENVVGLYSLPLAIAQNFVVNGREIFIPMVIEEPSVVAGVSFMARLARASGGFEAGMTSQEMIGQLQVLDLPDIQAAAETVLAHKQELLQDVANFHPNLAKYGGGPRDIQTRLLAETAIGPMLIIHLIVDVQDAMGANLINSMLEFLAPKIEDLTGGRVHLRILSNLADRRLAWARARFACQDLAFGDFSGEQVRDGIIEAWAFADADSYRAATHNKGVMNGVDAVVLATANDWRAVEAGAHAYAARSGRYQSLTHWSKAENGDLLGTIELPMALGIVGGATRIHPTAKANLKLMGVQSVAELGGIIAAVGLAQNLAALRALATEGIQKGHMSLHARQVALSAGALPSQADNLAAQLVAEKNIKLARALEILAQWNGNNYD